MANNELVSVRAIATDKDGKVYLGLNTHGQWVLLGEKSTPDQNFEQEIIDSVKKQTGLTFTPIHPFTIDVDSESVPGHKRTVHYFDGPAEGEPMPSRELINIHAFGHEEVTTLPMTKNARLVLTTWFAYHNGV